MRNILILSALAALTATQACTQSTKRSSTSQGYQYASSNEKVDANTFVTSNTVTGTVNSLTYNLLRGVAWVDSSASNRVNIKLDNSNVSDPNKYFSCNGQGTVLENNSTSATGQYVSLTISAPGQIGTYQQQAVVAQTYPTQTYTATATNQATVNFSYRQTGVAGAGDTLVSDQSTVVITSIGKNVMTGSVTASAANGLRRLSGNFRVYFCTPGDNAKITR